MSWRRALAIARSEWLLNRRDPRSLGVIFVLPVLLLILYGYGLNFDLEHLRVAVQDQDRSELSRELIRRAAASGYFDFVAEVTQTEQIAELLRRGRALMVLVIPPQFSKDFLSGRQAKLELVLDGSDAVTANTAFGYARALVARLASDWGRELAAKRGLPPRALQPITVSMQVLYNPNLDSAAFIVPGLIGVVMALMAALLTSTCIVRERETGTFEALLCTPVRPAEVILGKLIPYAVFSMIDIGLCVVAGVLIFGVRPAGSMVQFVAVSAVFVFACLAMGLMISGRAGSQRTAIVGGIMALMLPTIMLSGFVFPIINFPLALKAVANALPATHYLVAARTVYLRGVNLTACWQHVAVLAALALVAFVAAVRSFRAKL